MRLNKGIVTAFQLILNVFFSILIILLNKWLYVNIGFPNITLSMIHFTITFIGLIISEKFDVFCIKDIAIKEIFFISMIFCGSVVFTNLSLAENTVSTYQMAKMLITPCAVIMQIILYKKHFSTLVRITLVPITLGVVVTLYHDMQLNFIKTVYAVVGVLLTSLYQVMVNRKQREFQMDPMQLLYYQAPISAVLLFFVVPLLEPLEQTFARGWSLIETALVLVSGIVTFLVNLTSYWFIGKTTPLTMVGYYKFCLILLSSSLVFEETLCIYQALGIILTLAGTILYSHVKMRDTQAVQNKDKEKRPLYSI
ncbi:solute carrier family 35 member E3-like isoform X2 [Ceratina calcarata]|uniref:Solute carrier family 35 member E3-like isoform X2 n=1 Tax=Ceratina calcarata TaxID=156304 RepID=A0AAJ7IUQ5_9HYME|nr:solute carrier family 35 member E3-like isoform X2 [Ceratina calcarata]